MPFLRRSIPLHRSLRFRLFIVFSLFTAVTSVAFTSLYSVREINAFQQRSDEKARLLASLLATTIRLPLFSEDVERLSRHAAEIAGYPGVHGVTIFNAEGKLLARAGYVKRLPDSSVTSRNLTVTPGPMGAESEALLGSAAGDRPVGSIQLDTDDTELEKAIHAIIVSSTATALIAWAVITALCYLVLHWITKPLAALTSGISAIRGGDYDYRIIPESRDELADTAHAVNDLAAELRRRELENRKLQQEAMNSLLDEVHQERRTMMAKLIQTNRMTSLGLLVSGMAHEINTPNGAIKLAGQQMAKTWKSVLPILDRVAIEEGDFLLGGVVYSRVRDEVGKASDVVGRCSERIEKVINDLKTYNLGERSDVKSLVDVAPVVGDALAIIRAHGRYASTSIQIMAAPDLPPVAGNRYQLEQVFINLLLNSIQSVPEGRRGEIVITITRRPDNAEVAISVRDNGSGIEPDVMNRLMEPFFSTRMDKGGSGLGLYISDFIVREHNGRLEFASQPGSGTTATVTLPAAND